MPTTPANPALDAFDIAILDILQQDNTTPQRAIAEAVHLSPAAVQRRIHRLNTTGVVRANVALLEPTRVGQMLTILVEVQLVSERPELALPLRQRLLEEPSVQQCYYITGEADYRDAAGAAVREEVLDDRLADRARLADAGFQVHQQAGAGVDLDDGTALFG